MSPRKITSILKGKKRLSSKDFLEIYDMIWKGTAPVRYQDPDRWLGQTRGKNDGTK